MTICLSRGYMRVRCPLLMAPKLKRRNVKGSRWFHSPYLGTGQPVPPFSYLEEKVQHPKNIEVLEMMEPDNTYGVDQALTDKMSVKSRTDIGNA